MTTGNRFIMQRISLIGNASALNTDSFGFVGSSPSSSAIILGH